MANGCPGWRAAIRSYGNGGDDSLTGPVWGLTSYTARGRDTYYFNQGDGQDTIRIRMATTGLFSARPARPVEYIGGVRQDVVYSFGTGIACRIKAGRKLGGKIYYPRDVRC